MSLAGSQQQTFLRLVRELRPAWRRDPGLPVQIQALLARHKEFGSRDRRLYRELIYTTLRYLPWIEPRLDSDPDGAAKIVAWLAAETKATSGYRAALAGDWPTKATLRERAEHLGQSVDVLLPDWCQRECPAIFEGSELETQLTRAALWLRLQTDDPAPVAAEFGRRGWRWQESGIWPDAWRMLDEVDVTSTDAFAAGGLEVQDLGSQLVLASIGVEAGSRWFDACAGAGGKTLQLARAVGPTGRVDAYDIRTRALDELRHRAARARLNQVATVAGPKADGYDGVLIDAPCSGCGTWRRSPHLKWTTTPQTLADRAKLQQTLLARYAPAVRAGGRLVYATCSLARTENEAVVEAFLGTHPEFAASPFTRPFGFTPTAAGLTIWPGRHDTDGFFVAVMVRR